MTAQRYVHDILQPHVLPLLQRLPDFQQDNARRYTARVSQDCLRTVTTLPCPARSLYLSPIEHIWDHSELYEVYLPWVERHQKLLDLWFQSETRLNIMTSKLISTGKFNSYEKFLMHLEQLRTVEQALYSGFLAFLLSNFVFGYDLPSFRKTLCTDASKMHHMDFLVFKKNSQNRLSRLFPNSFKGFQLMKDNSGVPIETDIKFEDPGEELPLSVRAP
ncbi:transposable element Tcb2 transposase [Trichonephila clavipes]|uniref:Transposable element Tcb2 transposase n=1 Tax=Trichonephila clavipes TaxID=2585209 RepID=A0A8X6S7G9_TRICX|nr:transposable element Tcb2 transposase [Trichonephila clavipes]